MIAVKMCDQDQVDLVADDSKPLQGRQRRGAAINQEIDVVAGDVKAGIAATAGAKCVAAADESQLHRLHTPKNQRPRGAPNSRDRNQIGTTMTAPSRK